MEPRLWNKFTDGVTICEAEIPIGIIINENKIYLLKGAREYLPSKTILK
jgi:hypothetical protein